MGTCKIYSFLKYKFDEWPESSMITEDEVAEYYRYIPMLWEVRGEIVSSF